MVTMWEVMVGPNKLEPNYAPVISFTEGTKNFSKSEDCWYN